MYHQTQSIRFIPRKRDQTLHDHSAHPAHRTTLQGRLREVLVFELHKDGSREYSTMTLRGLYTYTMKSIMKRPPTADKMPSFLGSSEEDSLSDDDEGGEKGEEQAPPEKEASTRKVAFTDTTVLPQEVEFLRLKQESQQPLQQQQQRPISNTDLNQKTLTPSQTASADSKTLRIGKMEGSVPRRPSKHRSLSVSSNGVGGRGGGGVEMPNVTYRERLGGYLHPRDMRRLVTPFSATNTPELIVRRHVMLLNFDPLRAIVLRDRLLVLIPDGADSILISLERRLRGGIDELEKQLYGDHSTMASSMPPSRDNSDLTFTELAASEHGSSSALGIDSDVLGRKKLGSPSSEGPTYTGDTHKGYEAASDVHSEGVDEWEELLNCNWIDLAFEFQSVDAVLQTVCHMLSEEVDELRRRVHFKIGLLGDSHSSMRSVIPRDADQENLRTLKDEVNTAEQRVQGFVRAMNQVLDEDEDLALMNLSRLLSHPERFIQPVSDEILHEESDEPELILEGFLQQALNIVNSLQLLKGQIVTTEELVSRMLDTVRNRLLFVNTVVSLLSLCVAIASLVGSIFGMNLTNHLELDDDAFRQVVTGTLVGTVTLLCLLLTCFWQASVLNLPT